MQRRAIVVGREELQARRGVRLRTLDGHEYRFYLTRRIKTEWDVAVRLPGLNKFTQGPDWSESMAYKQ